MSACPHCHRPIDCTGLSGIVECPHCKKRFTCQPLKIQQPMIAEPMKSPLPLAPGPTIRLPSVTSLVRFRRSGGFFLDFLDLELRDYLTPIILKIIWSLCLMSGAFSAIAGAFSIGVSAYYVEEDDVISLTWKLIAWVASIGFIMICLVVVRVTCESLMVVFNIADSLSSIDKKIKVTHSGG